MYIYIDTAMKWATWFNTLTLNPFMSVIETDRILVILKAGLIHEKIKIHDKLR